MTQLTAAAVDELVRECLYRKEEVADPEVAPEGAIIVDGIVRQFGFHPERIKASRPQIAELLREVPDEFLPTGGGGMSFLQLCMDRHGNHWGEHTSMEALIALAIAANLGAYCMPREVWSSFPGGVPYVMFDPDAPEKEPTAECVHELGNEECCAGHGAQEQCRRCVKCGDWVPGAKTS